MSAAKCRQTHKCNLISHAGRNRQPPKLVTRSRLRPFGGGAGFPRACLLFRWLPDYDACERDFSVASSQKQEDDKTGSKKTGYHEVAGTGYELYRVGTRRGAYVGFLPFRPLRVSPVLLLRTLREQRYGWTIGNRKPELCHESGVKHCTLWPGLCYAHESRRVE